jgi:ABC-type uncharacterized transport system, ATPase component
MTAATSSGSSSAPAIETHELSKRFGRTMALAGLSMRVEPGEVFGLDRTALAKRPRSSCSSA